APRLTLRASATASASSFDPGMNQGTILVSARKMASVLIGGNFWFVIPKAVTYGAGGCTAPGASRRAPYDCQCIWYSTDGLPSPAAMEPSSVMQSRHSAVRLPL